MTEKLFPGALSLNKTKIMGDEFFNKPFNTQFADIGVRVDWVS